MIGYRGHAATPDIAVDGAELEEARWFTPSEVHDLRTRGQRTDSIEHFLVTTWLTEH
jgi:NAD+ diphosphatase